MAQAELDRIIEILRNNDVKKLRQQELAQQQARDDSERAFKLQQIAEADRRFAEEVKQHEQSNKIAQQAADLQLKMYKLQGSRALQEMGESYQKTGVAPGGQVNPMAVSSSGGGFSPVNPQNATGASITIPGLENLGSIQVATPEVAATREANLSRISMRPKVEAQIEESRALQSDLLNKQAAAKKEDFERAQMQKEQDFAREIQRGQQQMEIERFRAGAAERLEKLKLAGTESDLTPYFNQIVNADMSRDEVDRLPLSKQDKTKLMNAVVGSGAKIVDKGQKSFIGDFGSLISTIKYMDQVIANQPNTHNVLSSHLAGVPATFNNDLTTAEDELRGRTSTLRTYLKEQGNLSDRDTNRILSLLPSRFQPLEKNIQKRNNFVEELNTLIDTKLNNLAPAQRAYIKSKVGLDQIAPVPMPSSQSQTTAPAAAKTQQPTRIQYDINGNVVNSGGK